MRIKWLLLVLLLSLASNSSFAQGTVSMAYGYQPYVVAPAPVSVVYSQPVQLFQPVINTGYYAVPVTTYQYVPYQYVSGYVGYYPVNYANTHPCFVRPFRRYCW